MIVSEFNDTQGEFYAVVERVAPYRGVLKLVRLSNTNKVLREKKVTISYDAIFGPDVADVQEWGQQVTEWTSEIEKEKQ